MKIDVKKVAKLSNLTLTLDEEKEFSDQLENVVSYIEKLNDIDTSNIEPTAQVTGLQNAFQESNTNSTLTQDEAISASGKTHNGLFVVDKLVDTTS